MKQAADLVWQLPKSGTEKDLMKLLQSHYGCETQRRRYRQELKTLKRKPGQSIQDLHGEVARLMGLAYPGETGPRFDADAVECFINTFMSKSMRWHMRSKDLPTLADAMIWASTLESYRDDSSDDELAEHSPMIPRSTKVCHMQGQGDLNQTELLEALNKLVLDTKLEMESVKSKLKFN